jgi:hypothetical protein
MGFDDMGLWRGLWSLALTLSWYQYGAIITHILNAAMAQSTLKASASRAILLFYVIGTLLLLAFIADLVQGDGVDWILLGGAVAAVVAGIAYQRKRRRS